MALPTASLGQLPSMNQPSYVPTVLVPRKQNVYEQAIAAFLLNMAGQAGGQVAQNTFEKDTSASPTPWYKKPFSGAAENQQQQQFRLGQEGQASRQAADIGAADTRLTREMTSNKETAAANRAQERGLSMDRITAQRGLAAGEQSSANQRLMQELQARAAERGQTELFNTPTRDSQIALNAANVDEAIARGAYYQKTADAIRTPEETMAALQRMRAAGGQGGAAATATPAMQKLAQGGAPNDGVSSGGTTGTPITYDQFQREMAGGLPAEVQSVLDQPTQQAQGNMQIVAELLKQAQAGGQPGMPTTQGGVSPDEEMARQLGMQLQPTPVTNPGVTGPSLLSLLYNQIGAGNSNLPRWQNPQ